MTSNCKRQEGLINVNDIEIEIYFKREGARYDVVYVNSSLKSIISLPTFSARRNYCHEICGCTIS